MDRDLQSELIAMKEQLVEEGYFDYAGFAKLVRAKDHRKFVIQGASVSMRKLNAQEAALSVVNYNQEFNKITDQIKAAMGEVEKLDNLLDQLKTLNEGVGMKKLEDSLGLMNKYIQKLKSSYEKMKEDSREVDPHMQDLVELFEQFSNS